MESLIIAVDFDGTCVEHDYPAIGLDVEGAVKTGLSVSVKLSDSTSAMPSSGPK